MASECYAGEPPFSTTGPSQETQPGALLPGSPGSRSPRSQSQDAQQEEASLRNLRSELDHIAHSHQEQLRQDHRRPLERGHHASGPQAIRAPEEEPPASRRSEQERPAQSEARDRRSLMFSGPDGPGLDPALQRADPKQAGCDRQRDLRGAQNQHKQQEPPREQHREDLQPPPREEHRPREEPQLEKNPQVLSAASNRSPSGCLDSQGAQALQGQRDQRSSSPRGAALAAGTTHRSAGAARPGTSATACGKRHVQPLPRQALREQRQLSAEEKSKQNLQELWNSAG